ncbi:hypothetical protein J4477_04235 [Candidatus Pacearchaeota archaeon]|nr:hypothetical protein [Candidatus Pacearchaeota archaeon]
MVKVDDILKKYSGKLSNEINDNYSSGDISREYLTFKKEMMPQLSRYEKLAKAFGSFMKVRVSEKDRIKTQKKLDMAHLDITPSQVAVFSFFSMFFVFFIGLLIFLLAYFFQGTNFDFSKGLLFLFLVLIASFFVFYYSYTSPSRLANNLRLKSSSQMVPCILYVVVYMKHTSNLERAIAFASQHLQAPLSLDLKKIFWDVETGKYSTIKESLDHYLKTWEKDAIEFVEAFHLIESSLYEPSNTRRIQTLEKSLQVILEGVYEKMLSYSRDVRSPLTNIYMLGVVLPTLGLALLPLASALLGGLIRWYHVFILFNIIVPFFVFYMTNNVMMKRPGGYGENDILELNSKYPKYISKKPYMIAAIVCLPFFLLSLTPFLFQSVFFLETFNLSPDINLGVFGFQILQDVRLFDFKDASTGAAITSVSGLKSGVVGPFGIGALILGLFLPLSIAMFFAIAFKMKTKELIKDRNNTKELEMEFTNSLFQLGNRLGDGIPAEIAFARVAESTRGQRTEDFFRKVNLNLHQAGMSLDEAIFNNKRGAIIDYPSNLISTSMRILLESSKKGLKVAAESLMSISEYIKNIHKVESRLRDLLAEVISDMKSNMTFLAPLLAGIVVGLAGMIAFILNKLSSIFSQVGETGSQSVGFDLGTFLNIFRIEQIIPPYYIQIAVGIYLIQIIFILTNVLVTIDSGSDKLKRTADTGRFLKIGIILYTVVSFIAIVILSLLAGFSIGGLA